MGSIVLELQNELLIEGSKVSHLLRKAHVIASKLGLTDFDSWIQNELNGYRCSRKELPKYRKVLGGLYALNPYTGWNPIVIGDRKVEAYLCTVPFTQSIGEIEEMYQQNTNKSLQFRYNGEYDEKIQEMMDSPVPLPISLHVSPHLVYGIINTVKNCLIEWTLRLEREGIRGEDMTFNLDEQNSAKDIPQQINNYFGKPSIFPHIFETTRKKEQKLAKSVDRPLWGLSTGRVLVRQRELLHLSDGSHHQVLR